MFLRYQGDQCGSNPSSVPAAGGLRLQKPHHSGLGRLEQRTCLSGCSGQEPSWSSSREHCAEIWGKMGVRRKIWGERVTDQPCYSYPRQMTEALGAAEHCQTPKRSQNPKSQPLPCLQWTTNPTLKLQQPLPMPDTAYSHAARGTGAGDTMAKPLKSNKYC